MKKLLIILAVCSPGYIMAQNASGNSWSTTKASGDEATHFIKKAAKVDMIEIKAGKLAQEKSMNSGVRSYGEMIVKDHTASSVELQALAGRRNIQLPAADHHKVGANAGASSSAYMGASGYLQGDAANTWRGQERTSRLNGTANMRLSKAQTTPSKKHWNGSGTGWSDKHVTLSNTDSRAWTSDAGTSDNSAMATSGQSTVSATTWNTTTTNTTDIPTAPPAENLTEPGVASSGTLGVSGTTGTLGANAAFNGATMGTDNASTDMDAASSTQSVTTSPDMSQPIDFDTELSTIDNEHMQKLESLKGKTGAEFDREYVNMMATDHSKAIALYEKASMSTDPEIKAFASKMLPVLRQHQEAAKNLMNSVNSGM